MDINNSLPESNIPTQTSGLNNVDNNYQIKKKRILLGSAIIIFFLLIVGGALYFKPYVLSLFHQKQSTIIKVIPTQSISQNTPTISNSLFISPTSSATSSGINNSKLSAEDVIKINNAYNSFGISFLKKITEGEPNKNVSISPLSLEMAFSMIMMGALTDVQKEMVNTLGYGDKVNNEEIRSLATKYLNSSVANNSDIIFSVANSIWIQKTWEKAIIPQFLSINNDAFKARIESLDLTNMEGIRKINDWVSGQTRGKITKILDQPLDPNAIMALVNAVYFKGNWTIPFDSKLTKQKQFTTGTNQQIKVDMMENSGYFDYMDNANFQAVKIPYGKEARWNMVIFLPKTSLAQFLNTVSNANWNKWQNEFVIKQGIIDMPRYKIEYQIPLENIMPTLGMKLAFTEGNRFPGMISQPAWISSGIHKTYIEVNEEGTEAAAVTELMAPGGANLEEPFRLEINHPFLYTITDSNDIIVFIGVMQQP